MKVLRLPLAIPLALGVSLFGACNGHGEGGRCDPNNVDRTTGVNLDCASGLVCTPGSELLLPGDSGAFSGTDICCPTDRTTSAPGTICAIAPPTPGSDASIPDGATEAGGDAGDASSDAAADADASSDASQDSSTDAPDGD